MLLEPREAFEARYIESCEHSVEFGRTHISIPCSCEDGGGPWHWAAVKNNPEAIEDHFENESWLANLRPAGST